MEVFIPLLGLIFVGALAILVLTVGLVLVIWDMLRG